MFWVIEHGCDRLWWRKTMHMSDVCYKQHQCFDCGEAAVSGATVDINHINIICQLNWARIGPMLSVLLHVCRHDILYIYARKTESSTIKYSPISSHCYNFFQNIHNRHPTARPWGWAIGSLVSLKCLLISVLNVLNQMSHNIYVCAYIFIYRVGSIYQFLSI